MRHRNIVLLSLCTVFLSIGGCGEKKEVAAPLKLEVSDFIPTSVIALPAWNGETKLIKLTSAKDSIEVMGDDSRFGYQVSTPQIAVPEQVNAQLKISLNISSGRICIGVLNENRQSWILSPSDAQSPILFNTGDNKSVYVVLANCNNSDSGNEKSRFTINSSSLGLAQSVAK